MASFEEIYRKHKPLVLTLGAVAFIMFLFIYGRYSPEESNLFPKCIFYSLTSYKCPGCGSQRAIHSLLNLDIKSAFSYNPLLVCTLPYIIMAFITEYDRKHFKKLREILYNGRVAAIWLVVVIAYWILRNVYSF